jgi:hypothetical protein
VGDSLTPSPPQRCANCGLPIEENAPDEWLHIGTAERECSGYPRYGNCRAEVSA